MDRIILTPLKQIFHPKGDIYHAMKKSDAGFFGFGEAYFSTVLAGEIKGWKKHTAMTLNLVVPAGEIEFVVYDGKEFRVISLSQNNYQRLTIPPEYWVAFKGIGEETNLLLNLASIEHNPSEAVNVELQEIDYGWKA